MVTNVHVSTRVPDFRQHIIPRQSTYHAYAEKWEELLHWVFQACEHQIFFVKDKVDKKDVKVEYCPTMQMLADFFTKLPQGKLFTKFREVIMGYKHISTLR